MQVVLKVNGETVRENVVMHGTRGVRIVALHSRSAVVQPAGGKAAQQTVSISALRHNGIPLDEYACVELIAADAKKAS